MSGFVRFDEGLNMDAQINTFGNWEGGGDRSERDPGGGGPPPGPGGLCKLCFFSGLHQGDRDRSGKLPLAADWIDADGGSGQLFIHTRISRSFGFPAHMTCAMPRI